MTWMDSKYTDKDATCALCGGTIPAGEPRKYDKDIKKSAHAKCAAAASPGGTSTPLPLVPCSACGTLHHAEVMQAVVNEKWKESMLCADCNWLRKAQFGLKVAGLWRPTPAQEAQ